MAPSGTGAGAQLVPARHAGPRRLDGRGRSLCGADWTVREALGETWRWYVDKPLEDWRTNVAEAARRGQSAPGWWPASVPGSVVTDLWRAGELPDPYRGRGARAAEWTAHRSWVCRRTVELPALADDEWAVLEFDGIDPAGSVFWDGRPLGRVPGTYRPGRFAVPADAADAGPHRLAVVVDPVPASQPQVGRTELVRVHRPRMNEGWDFCPRFPHQGIWRGVRLAVGPVHLASVAVATRLDGDCRGTVRVTGKLEVADDRPVPVDLDLLDAGGRVVAERRDRVDGGRLRQLRLDLDVPRPELWWPRGFGAATVYTVRLRLAGAAEPAWSGTVGFRRATLVANAGAPASTRPYTAVVNDRVIPLHGWNWVPADAQYGAVDPHRVRHLVGLAARSGARLLRVWGGGLIGTEEFYDACDRAGLLVWQEFSQSSSGLQSAPATDAEFVRLMTAEAAAVVPARAHHPSLLIWGGGNELDLDGVPLDEERSPALAALRDTVRRLDPGRAWLPTSPSGPAFHHRLDVIAAAPRDQHDVHGPWEHQGLRDQHTLANAGSCLAHTEFGVEGMTNRRALDELLPDGDRCTSCVDHRGDPKPAFHAVTRAFAPQRGTVRVPTAVWAGEDRLTAEAWVWAEQGVAPGSRVCARLRAADGRILAERRWCLDGPVGHPRPAGTITVDGRLVPSDAVVVWELVWESAEGAPLDREVVLACTGRDFAPLLDLAPAALDVTARAADGATVVEVAQGSGPLVVGLQIVDDRSADAAGWVVGDGDPRPLLPGEARAFVVRGERAPPPLRVRVEAWNTSPTRIELDEEQRP